MKKWIALLLCLLLPAAALADAPAPQWVNSNVIGNVTADTPARLQDDFHLTVNRDWLLTAKVQPGQSEASISTEREIELREQIVSLLEGKPQTSHEGRLCQRLYAAMTDMEKRNELGLAPVMPCVEAIMAIETLDHLTAYQMRDDQLCCTLYGKEVLPDFSDSSYNRIAITAPFLSMMNSDEYRTLTPVGKRYRDAYVALLQTLLPMAGFDGEAADELIAQTQDMEEKIATACLGVSDQMRADYLSVIYNPVEAEELDARSPVFPLSKLLGDYVKQGATRFMIPDVAWLKRMNELYTQQNVEGFKAYLLCQTLYQAAPYLDQPCIDAMDAYLSAIVGMPMTSDVRDSAYTTCNGLMKMAIGRMYAENFVSEETKQSAEGIIAEVVEVYKHRIQKTDWLSAQTRAKALRKLDTLRVRVAYPDDWSPYEMDDVIFPEKNETVLGDLILLERHNQQNNIAQACAPANLDAWPSQIPPQTVNAGYNASANAIIITAGILGGGFYDPQGSRAQKLGTIGIIIGHEITHAFDKSGSRYDENGNMVNWWTDADRTAFEKRSAKVSDYYGAIEVLPGQRLNGVLTVEETVADLGGMSCILEIAAGEANFDYDAFFRSVANLWKCQKPIEMEEAHLTNVHASEYLRTNVNVQQFQEFYDTYGVKEGDNMYLAPEYRLSVW